MTWRWSVRAFFEDEAGGLDRVAQSFHARDSASFHASAIHEQGVQLYAAIAGKETPPPGVEGGIVFHDGHGSLNSIDGGSSAHKDGGSGLKGFAYS